MKLELHQPQKSIIAECETRSVTPTSEIADKHVDIDEEFAIIKTTKSTKKFTSSTKSQQKTKSVHKRA